MGQSSILVSFFTKEPETGVCDAPHSETKAYFVSRRSPNLTE
jgi:hypothetical protein